jgi:uncharacterized protein (TIGR00255 family)
MLKSMTGFGKATFESKEKKITVEIKSLNSKQSDVSIRLPQHYKEKELILRNEINQCLNRGKIDAGIWFDGNETDKSVQFNEALIKDYYNQLEKISKTIGTKLENEQVLQLILRMPDVFKTEVKNIDDDEWNLVLETTKQALSEVDKFRIQEGNVLEKDFIYRIQKIEELLKSVEPFEAERIEKIRERINQNLSENFDKSNIDQNRFEQEIIFYLEKFDITEEKIRLKHHCSYFFATMKNEEMAGRKLGFITQEIGREINTIGSKANHTEIQKIVVQMKDELEKIKEQLLNIL